MANEKEDTIMVSISCITYNQEDYIEDALKGFVMQKTNFAYEVLVHDDASTDRTADIVREYERKYPDLIKPIYQTENQYSQGISPSQINYGRAKGKYIAICEGDDYWTDPYKLQKQFDAMEKHPELDMCGHAVQRVRADNKQLISITSPADKETIFSLEQLLLISGNRVVDTCSYFLRASVFHEYNFWRKNSDSSIIQILGAVRGGILYLPDCMGTYRVASKGSWTVSMTGKKGRDKWAKGLQEKIQAIDALDEETGYEHTKIIQRAKHITEVQRLGVLQDWKSMLNPKYAEALAMYPKFYIAKVCLYKYFPWIGKIKKLLKKE